MESIPIFITLTLNPSPKSPKWGEGLVLFLFVLVGRRGWGMRANLPNWDTPIVMSRRLPMTV
jgi:hypothetical protein